MEFEIQIDRLGIHGEGVGIHEGYVVFVPGALPGERVSVRLVEKRKTYGRGELIDVVTSSPHRKKPVCPHFGLCGGCQIMHLEYPEQLVAKRQRVVDALTRIGKLTFPEVLPCVPSNDELNYRNKIQLPVIGSRLGLYASNSHNLVAIDRCFIHCPLGQKVFEHIRSLISDEVAQELRHILIKSALRTQQVLVVLISKKKGSNHLRPFAEELMKRMPEIRGVVQNVNTREGNVILGEAYHLLAGSETIEEEIGGLRFSLSAASFFQVNPPQAEKLYRRVAEFCALDGTKRLLDAFCGVGTLSLILAQRAKEVIGVECVAKAVDDARANAKKNGIANTRFVAARAEDFVKELKEIDGAVINPPRKGCEPHFLEALKHLGPARIVYISCDPATLARDLAILCAGPYTIETVEPFDMFPQTAHVETVALLRKQ